MLDLVIEGATVVDGTGGPRRQADVGVEGGTVVAVGKVDGRAGRRIDADGLVLAPGVVDVHTHYDAQVMWDAAATPSPFHGVTTVFGGNCGFTIAPLAPSESDYLMRMLARVEGMPLEALASGASWDWTDFGSWLDRIEGNLGVNAGFLVGHSAIRRVVMGADAVGGSPTPEQLAAMEQVLDASLAAGGLGLSSSLAPSHNDGDGRPVPSRAAGRDELLALARVVSRHPGTTLEFLPAVGAFSDDVIELMAELSLAADRPLNWNALGVDGRNPESHLAQLAASDRAAERGATVVALTLPDLVRFRLNLRTGFIFDALPAWSEVIALPLPERRVALADPAVRERLRPPPPKELGALRRLTDWSRFEIAETFAPELAPLIGRPLDEVAAERGQHPVDAGIDIALADDLQTLFLTPALADDDETWKLRAEVWRDPRVVLGASDAGAHLDMQCSATYPTAMLAGAVRERGLVSLEEAVHLLCDVPARLYGARGRGRIAEGWAADLFLFDPDTVAPEPVRTRSDLPGGASRLYAEAVGVEAVFVNGVEVVTGGELTGARPGTLLRSGRDTDTVHAGARQR